MQASTDEDPPTGDQDDRVRAWLLRVMAKANLKATPFAKRASLAPSTILRALDPASGSSLERASILKIQKTYNVPGPDDARAATPAGFREMELLPIEADPAAAPLAPNQYDKLVNTRALELAGYMVGDRVTFDMSIPPVAGDVVEAQVYGAGAAQTVLRVYDEPYLVARTADPNVPAKPLLVDRERVRIAAVAVRLQRQRNR